MTNQRRWLIVAPIHNDDVAFLQRVVIQVFAFVFISHSRMDERQLHQVKRQVQPIPRLLGSRALRCRAIDHDQAKLTRFQRLQLLAHHLAQHRFDPRHTPFQPAMDAHVADRLLAQRERAGRLSQRLVQSAIAHHNLHQLCRTLYFPRPAKRFKFERQRPVLRRQFL